MAMPHMTPLGRGEGLRPAGRPDGGHWGGGVQRRGSLCALSRTSGGVPVCTGPCVSARVKWWGTTDLRVWGWGPRGHTGAPRGVGAGCTAPPPPPKRGPLGGGLWGAVGDLGSGGDYATGPAHGRRASGTRPQRRGHGVDASEEAGDGAEGLPVLRGLTGVAPPPPPPPGGCGPRTAWPCPPPPQATADIAPSDILHQSRSKPRCPPPPPRRRRRVVRTPTPSPSPTPSSTHPSECPPSSTL